MPALRDNVPAISAAVEAVVMRAIAKLLQDRFASVQDFATALQQASQAKSSYTVPLAQPHSTASSQLKSSPVSKIATPPARPASTAQHQRHVLRQGTKVLDTFVLVLDKSCQAKLSLALLCLSLLLFASLTVLHNQPIFGAISKIFLDFFGWSAYLLALGLVAFALVHLIEGVHKQYYLRWSLVIGLVILWLLVLLESRLIVGRYIGILAEFLVMPFLGWSTVIAHIITLGLLLITTIITSVRFTNNVRQSLNRGNSTLA